MRAPALAVLTALLTTVLLGHAADAPAAITLGDGSVIANTDWSTPTAQVASGPACRVAPATAGCLPLADPAGTPAGAPVELRAAGAPEDDLEAALARLAAAGTGSEADAARSAALAILEGDARPGRPTAYAGLPLLNWDAPAKVKVVPAGGVVDVREVRFPDHVLGDTWLLDFEDPSRP